MNSRTVKPVKQVRHRRLRRADLCLCFATLVTATGIAPSAHAYTVTIAAGSRAIYLQIGAGGYSTPSSSGGSPSSNSTVNTVSVSISAVDVGSGTSRAMTSNSTVSQSPIDGFAFCTPPAQVYIGAWSRPGAGAGVATLTVTTPASLTSGTNTIPFNQISWEMDGNGDSTFQFPDGTFTGGTQTLATFPRNTWKEQCMSFKYANTIIPAAGTYSGRATYTLSLP